MWRTYSQYAQLDPRVQRATLSAQRYPRWVWTGTGLAAAPMLLALALGAVLLLLAAFIVGGTVFTILGFVARLFGSGPASTPDTPPAGDGRVNVRVLD